MRTSNLLSRIVLVSMATSGTCVAMGCTSHVSDEPSVPDGSTTGADASIATDASTETPDASTASDAATADASNGDAGDSGTAIVDAGPESGSTTFPAKANCTDAVEFVHYASPTTATHVALASSESSPVGFVWNRSGGPNDGAYQSCSTATFGNGSWQLPSAPLPIGNQMCGLVAGRDTHVAAGGGATTFLWADRNADSSWTLKTLRSTGVSFGSGVTVATDASYGDSFVNLHVTPTQGRGIVSWTNANSDIVVSLLSPNGTSVTSLDPNATSSALVAAVTIDDSGNGFVVWTEAGTSNRVMARAIRNGAYVGGAVPLAATGTPTANGLDVAMLPGGDAYVVWPETSPSGLRGASLHVGAQGTSATWSVSESLDSGFTVEGLRAVASDDGEVTVAWGRAPRAGLLARRRPVGQAWSPPTTIAADAKTPSGRRPLFLDGRGDATLLWTDDTYSLFHARATKGATTWNAPVRVDVGALAGDVSSYVTATALPTTGDVLAVWQAAGSLRFATCR
ncbi:MAG: hypothetical protein U0169_15690 [Polyangiaceae bacterium]